MRNKLSVAFDDLSVAQTEALLAGIDSLPADGPAARRIRRRVEKEVCPKRTRRRAAVRVLVPVAACLMAIALVFACFPQAAQAIASFLGLNYTPSRYMSELPASRTPVPSVDEALEAAAPPTEAIPSRSCRSGTTRRIMSTAAQNPALSRLSRTTGRGFGRSGPRSPRCSTTAAR